MKNRKADYHRHKDEIKNSIREIYHSHGGVDGYRTIHAYLCRRSYDISRLTVHKYMNTEMQLFSISRKKKPDYEHGVAHKVYENKLKQNFDSYEINQKWCTDFTYLFLTDGSKRYNCTIIDLHDRSVVASITDRNITADLAKRTLEKAIKSQPGIDLSKLMVHSDQGSQYTSKEYTEFCEELGITQSMSKAGYPYDNAPMERYFNTLKNDLIYQHYYHTEEELYTAVEEFAYVQYNHVRPHSYNNYKTPYEARYGCFLQALFGQSCKTFLDIVACPNWTKLQSIWLALNRPAEQPCRHYELFTIRGTETVVLSLYPHVHVF